MSAALKVCLGCGAEVWPFQEMQANGAMVSKCPSPECGSVFPEDEAEKPVVRAIRAVAPLREATEVDHALRATPVPAPSELGSSELRYLREALLEADTDLDRTKRRIQRALALIQ